MERYLSVLCILKVWKAGAPEAGAPEAGAPVLPKNLQFSRLICKTG
jgi:hypothetical protein